MTTTNPIEHSMQFMLKILPQRSRSGFLELSATGPLSYIVVLVNGSTVRRYVDSIKGRQQTSPNINITPEDDNTFQLIPEVTSSNVSNDLPEEPVQIEVSTTNAASSETVTSTYQTSQKSETSYKTG